MECARDIRSKIHMFIYKLFIFISISIYLSRFIFFNGKHTIGFSFGREYENPSYGMVLRDYNKQNG